WHLSSVCLLPSTGCTDLPKTRNGWLCPDVLLKAWLRNPSHLMHWLEWVSSALCLPPLGLEILVVWTFRRWSSQHRLRCSVQSYPSLACLLARLLPVFS